MVELDVEEVGRALDDRQEVEPVGQEAWESAFRLVELHVEEVEVNHHAVEVDR